MSGGRKKKKWKGEKKGGDLGRRGVEEEMGQSWAREMGWSAARQVRWVGEVKEERKISGERVREVKGDENRENVWWENEKRKEEK